MKPVTIDVVAAAALFGLGRSAAYEAAARGELCVGVPVLKVGGRYRVPVAALETVLGPVVGEHLADTA